VTTRLILGYDRQIALWVGDRTGAEYEQDVVAIGVARNWKLVAGVVFSHFTGRSFVATIAAEDPRWCRKGILAGLFAYPFQQAGAAVLTCYIAEHNKRSLKLCRGLGFKDAGRVRDFFPDGDAIMLDMVRSECKWLQDVRPVLPKPDRLDAARADAKLASEPAISLSG
jgi:RimJ/RimL family protein N-acetyltransferase